jgi:hypothetical protein
MIYISNEDVVIEFLESRGYEHQFDFGEGGYDWGWTQIYTKGGRVFHLSDGGCSCSSFMDDHVRNRYGPDSRWLGYEAKESVEGQLVELTSLSAAKKLKDDSYYTTDFDIDKFVLLGLR